MHDLTIWERIKSIFANEQNKYWYLDVSLASLSSHFIATIIELKFLQSFHDKTRCTYLAAKIVHEFSEVFFNSLLSSASFHGYFHILKYPMEYIVADNKHKSIKQEEESDIKSIIGFSSIIKYSPEIVVTAFSSCVFENAGIKILDRTSIIKINNADKLFTIENFSKGVLSGIGSIFGESVYHIITHNITHNETDIYYPSTESALNPNSPQVISILPETEEKPDL